MSRKLSLALFTHSLRSDWNNGNAHFLRGLARELGRLGHRVVAYEDADAWSTTHLLGTEANGAASLQRFAEVFGDLEVRTYTSDPEFLCGALREADVAIVHEWHSPEFVEQLLKAREKLACKLLFHDTHHRAWSAPGQIRALGVHRFDGVLAFGDALQRIYRDQLQIQRVWTLHEAADTSIFFPQSAAKAQDVVWVGNWGDGERSRELTEFLIRPARRLPLRSFAVYGVRYPEEGQEALRSAGIDYRGYLPNLSAPAAYAASRVTLHVPRQQYNGAMTGIPTIRVFEALAAGIPLISAPWQDAESLFEPGDFCRVENGDEMTEAVEQLLGNPRLAAEQAARGRATVLARHTCAHRAAQLTTICEEVLG